MSAKKKITTDATKVKLPLPKGHPQVGGRPRKRRVRCLNCEKLVSADPTAVHSCYDAKAVRASLGLDTPSPIAGQPLPADLGSQPAPEVRAIPCGADYPVTVSPTGYTEPAYLPPDTSAYPWPLKAAWWMDGLIPRLRTWTAHQLTRLAGWVQG